MRCRLGGRFTQHNLTLNANKLFTHSTKRTKGDYYVYTSFKIIQTHLQQINQKIINNYKT